MVRGRFAIRSINSLLAHTTLPQSSGRFLSLIARRTAPPMASPSPTGTAFPAWMYCCGVPPPNRHPSGNCCRRVYSATLRGRSSSGWQSIVALLSGLVVNAGAGRSQERRRKKPLLPPQEVWAPPRAAACRRLGRSLQFPPSGTSFRYFLFAGPKGVKAGVGSSRFSSACRSVTHGRRPLSSVRLWVGGGNSTGSPSRDPMKMTRSRVWGTPKSAAFSRSKVM